MRLVDENEFARMLSERRDIVLHLSADWSGPCRILSPILESVAQERRLAVVKVNIHNNPAIVAKYQVRSVPRILFIRKGEVVIDLLGMPSQLKLEEACKEAYGC